jgi:hypothetical protein
MNAIAWTKGMPQTCHFLQEQALSCKFTTHLKLLPPRVATSATSSEHSITSKSKFLLLSINVFIMWGRTKPSNLQIYGTFSRRSVRSLGWRSQRGACRCFYHQPTLEYPKVGDYLASNRRIWNLKVKVRTQDTDLGRFEPPE